MKKKRKRTCIIVGAGHRAMLYASYTVDHPDDMEVVGVADPSRQRREAAAKRFGIEPNRCFESAEALAREPRLSDFIINGTMDHQHVPTSLPLLDCGYDMLLEKPFATNEEEMWRLVNSARQNKCRVAICHVLRYAPFYAAIRQEILDGAVGEIINIQASEHVSYHHMAVGFVRGKWRRRDYCQSTMLMAKCCHDLDLLTWLKSGVAPKRVASFASNFQFRPEKAPPGAGTRCLVDCPVEKDCLYSARKHYIDHPNRWTFYVWDSLEHLENPGIEDKIESLKTSVFGQCAWKTDMDVVDHQSVAMEYEDGCTATLNMVGGCARPSRSIHIVGTEGEIEGRFEDARFRVLNIDPRPGKEYSEKIVDLNVQEDTTGVRGGHGGGDMRMVEDFLKTLNGETPSISSTDIEDSIAGHLLGFRANQSVNERRTVQMEGVEVL